MFPPISNDNLTRTITITDNLETWEMKFSYPTVKDSEALRYMLSFIDPGDNYTVTYKRIEE